MRRWSGCVLAVVLVLAGTAPRAETPWEDVAAAAGREGKLVLYNSSLGASYYRAVVRAFEQKYSITVEALDVRAAELRERIRVEQAAGRYLGDAIIYPRTPMSLLDRDGMLAPHGGVPNAATIRPVFSAGPMRLPLYTALYGILISDRLVKEGEEPKSWRDLIDERWRGKILLDDPRAVGNGFALFFATHQGLGAAFQERLSGQAPVLSRDVRNDERRVARGEFPI